VLGKDGRRFRRFGLGWLSARSFDSRAGPCRYGLICRELNSILDGLSGDVLRLIDERIAAHERAPETSAPLAQMAAELREEYRL